MEQKKIMRFGGMFLAILLCVVIVAAAYDLIPVGRTAGIRMKSKGVLVTDFSAVQTVVGEVWPAKQAGLIQGDIIHSINGESVTSNEDLQKFISEADSGAIRLQVDRDGKTLEINITPVTDQEGNKRIGVLARDSIAGIGTITYVDPNTGAYGSLGHGICDAETGVLIPLQNGELTESTVAGVQKGLPGEPGALQGEFSLDNTLGTVEQNTSTGIFGHFMKDEYYRDLSAYPVAAEGEITLGNAQILSNISGQSVEKYQIEIVKLYDENDAYGRSMLLHVTDERLLAATGGIVQGMSGSPVIQNGKLIGAVTHVLVNDPTRGYGVLVQDMLREMNN